MVATSNVFLPLPGRIVLTGELSLVNVQRRMLPDANLLPQWHEQRGEFDMLEPACQSENAVWSQWGSWDM